MAESMVERVLRMMDEAEYEWAAKGGSPRPLAVVRARAAIEAMRRYTSPMIEAGLSEISDSTVQEPKATAWDAIRFHRAAIDFALSDIEANTPTERESA